MNLNQSSVNKLFSLINDAKSIFIVGHKSPDGDCIGSVLALYEFIKINYDKQVDIGFDGKIPYNLESYVEHIDILDDVNRTYDLSVVLDCGDTDRIGKYKPVVENSTHTFCIDHHKTNTNFADENIVVPDMSSTGELLYHVLDRAGKKINKTMAEYIYFAIVTDTGKFAYSSTTSETHVVASRLIDMGIDIAKMDTMLYNSKPFNVVNAYISCISNIDFFYNNQLGIAKITSKTIEDDHIDVNDMEGIAEFIREIKEIEVSCLLKQISENSTKVSMRSKQVFDVAEFCKKFNGGGHNRAAGFTSDKNIEETEKIIVEEFKNYLGE